MACVGKRGRMSVVWAATSPESGLFHPVEGRSEVKDLSDRFNDLRSYGQGYLEVRSPNREFPVLILTFRDDHAIIHLFTDEESAFLLVGDGTVPSDVTVDVPIMDDLTSFTSDFVLSLDHAWDVVQNFVHAGTYEELGEWCEL
jgi:hypothetical protein